MLKTKAFSRRRQNRSDSVASTFDDVIFLDRNHGVWPGGGFWAEEVLDDIQPRIKETGIGVDHFFIAGHCPLIHLQRLSSDEQRFSTLEGRVFGPSTPYLMVSRLRPTASPPPWSRNLLNEKLRFPDPYAAPVQSASPDNAGPDTPEDTQPVPSPVEV